MRKNHPVKQSKRRCSHKYGMEPFGEKNVFFTDLDLKCFGGLSCVSVLEHRPESG